MTEGWSNWPAPAKLNLFLHIVGRRDDGYHLLQTVFQLLDWGDTVRLRVRADDAIVRTQGLADVAPEKDLAVRAAQALRARGGKMFGADIAVDKKIPTGGGLGGGSSDAATVLVALNELWGLRFSVDTLAEIGLTLGADVPVFVRGHSAWAEGVGEQIVPLKLPLAQYVIVDPRVNVPTAALFQSTELTRNSPRLTISGFLDGVETANAFAPVVRARFAEVASALDWLGQHGDARLSGSGGCVFVATQTAQRADAIVRDCPAAFRAVRANGVNRSPLLDALELFRSAKNGARKN
jgi:4-diphosphocytidyl-2-C-methyl-D-erythritol kinase